LIIKIADRLKNTEDFLYSPDSDYASKYWNKATELMDILYDREEEVKARFGEKTLQLINWAVLNIGDLVADYHPDDEEPCY
jgi:hypothetical protein